MLNQRIAAMGRGEQPPTEVNKIRYEDMRAILLNRYREEKISLDKLVTLPDGTTTLEHTGIKFLDEHFKGMRLQQINNTDVLRAYRTSRVDAMCKRDEARVIEGETPERRAERLQKKRDQHERTVNRDLALLRRMVNLTIEEKKLQLASAKFPMVNEDDNVRTGFVEPAKFAELLEAMPEILQPYLLFYYETGCRPKAARAIVWDWVKLDEGMIYIPVNTTKNDDHLPVPLLRRRFHSDPVFVTTNFRKAFRAACVRLGLGRKTGSKELRIYYLAFCRPQLGRSV
jgi:integrase